MISVRAILLLLSIPFAIIFNIIHTWLVGSRFRKHRGVGSNVTLLLADTVLKLPVADCQYIRISANFQIHRVLPLLHLNLVSDFPGYGQRFDNNSTWLVKNPDPDCSNAVVIYLHGGGYFIDVSPPQLESILAAYKLTNNDVQRNLSVLYLDYQLACDGHLMPYQLHQLHETYTELVEKGYKRIILVGDSAGGNLAITYCQYLKQIRYKLFPRHLILVSPWTKLFPEPHQHEPGQSYYDNKGKDILNYETSVNPDRMTSIVGQLENLNSLLISPGNKKPIDRNDWTEVPTFNDAGHGILVIAGEDEVLLDDILDWCSYGLGVPEMKQFVSGTPKYEYEYVSKDPNLAKVQVYIEPMGIHDSMFVLENKVFHMISRVPALHLSDIDRDKYFGVTRVAQFLNEVAIKETPIPEVVQ